MKGDELKSRTRTFALKIIHLVESLPHGKVPDVLGKQLLRSATSVGANYRAACRAQSKADFLAKLAIVEGEADESSYWLELLGESQVADPDQLLHLQREANELTAIIVASIKHTKRPT